MNYVFIYAIMLFVSSCYASETPQAVIIRSNRAAHSRHCQRNRYNTEDIVATAKNGFADAKKAYEAGKYSEAAMFASGALGYLDNMKPEIIWNYASNPIDQKIINTVHYIIADCHLNHLNSPQRALESLRHIHDQEIYFESNKCIISSKMATLALHAKASELVGHNNHLSSKLKTEAYFYENKYSKSLYKNYIDAISQQNIEQQEIIIAQLSQLQDRQAPLRKVFLPLLSSHQGIAIANLFALESKADFNDIISTFISCDGPHIISFLEKKLNQLPSNQSGANAYMKNYIHYSLGLLYYHQGNHKKSFDHFTKTTESEVDLPTQCKILRSFNQLHTTLSYEDFVEAMAMIHKLCLSKKNIPRNNDAVSERIQLLFECAYHYAQEAIEHKQYKKAFYLADICLRDQKTYSIGTDILILLQTSYADPDYTINSNTFLTVVDHFKKYNDEESLMCLSTIFAKHALRKKTIDVQNSHFNAHYLEYALKSQTHTRHEKHLLKQLCADMYYLQGKNTKDQYQKIEYLKKAIFFNKHEALIELATFIAESKMVDTTEKDQIVQQLQELIYNSNVSIQTQAIKILSHMESLNAPETIKEFSQADYIAIKLAEDYINGKKNKKTNNWEVQPNYDKARQVLESLPVKDSSIIAQSLLAQSYYFCGKKYHGKAQDLFLSQIQQITTFTETQQKQYQQQKYAAYCYLCAITLHTLNPQNIHEASQYYYKAVGMDVDKKNMIYFRDLLNNITYQAIEKFTAATIKTKNTQECAIELCTLLGVMFYEQNSSNRQHYKINKDHAIQCLVYAAENNDFFAQVSIATHDPSDISILLKRKYAQNAHSSLTMRNNNAFFLNLSLERRLEIIRLLANRCVTYKHSWRYKYESIQTYYQQDKERELIQYTSSPDFAIIPHHRNDLFTTTDEQLAQTFYQDAVIKKYITTFDDRYKQGSSKYLLHVLNITFNYIYALMNSSDPKLIQISASYATKMLSMEMYKGDAQLTYILSICYYKLSQNPTIKYTLSSMYLKKSAELGHSKAIEDLKAIGSAIQPIENSMNAVSDENKILAAQFLLKFVETYEAKKKK